MDNFEYKIQNILSDLKENYFAYSIKSEFEAEGASFEDVQYLKKIADTTGLNFSLKIGGCEAVTDLKYAKLLNVNTIIAPMIETPYAFKKFMNAVKSVYNTTANTEFLINIETVTGFNNMRDIIMSDGFDFLSGIVLGRYDMANSLGLTRDDVNNNQIFNIAQRMACELENLDKKFIVGGGVCPKSVQFFRKLSYLSHFETRKIVFDYKILKTNKVKDAIVKAIEFETLWLKNKSDNMSANDIERIQMLEKVL